MAEAEDLKSSQCGFDPHSGHHVYIYGMKFTKIALIATLFSTLALSGCSSGSSEEDSDEYKMNQYYDCVQRYESKGLYTSDEIENVCGGLRP